MVYSRYYRTKVSLVLFKTRKTKILLATYTMLLCPYPRTQGFQPRSELCLVVPGFPQLLRVPLPSSLLTLIHSWLFGCVSKIQTDWQIHYLLLCRILGLTCSSSSSSPRTLVGGMVAQAGKRQQSLEQVGVFANLYDGAVWKVANGCSVCDGAVWKGC